MDFLYGSLENDVKTLSIYKVHKNGIYRGIHKKYFSKWEGWDLLEKGEDVDKVDQAAINFYIVFFFFHMKLDLIENPVIRWALLNFATMHGKRKAISKLEQVLGLPQTGAVNSKVCELINAAPKGTEYKLLLELVEFYSFIDRYESSDWVIDLFRLSEKYYEKSK
jgi:hypothetical protein